MKVLSIGGSLALAMVTALAFSTPASADPTKGFTLNLDYEAGSYGLAGGINGNLGGTVVKRMNESGTGSVNEVDVNVKVNKNGLKNVNGTVHSGAYGYNENMIKTRGVGATATGSASGSYVKGGASVNLSVKKK